MVVIQSVWNEQRLALLWKSLHGRDKDMIFEIGKEVKDSASMVF
jgi:hypothetical protein